MALPMLQEPMLSEDREVAVFDARWGLCHNFSSPEPYELVAALKMPQIATYL